MMLPQEPGFYLWYDLDLDYMDVGLVRVSLDEEKHLQWLADNPRPTFYVYELHSQLRADLGVKQTVLTMYHQAHDHLPRADATGRPLVDGWIPFDWRWVDHWTAKIQTAEGT